MSFPPHCGLRSRSARWFVLVASLGAYAGLVGCGSNPSASTTVTKSTPAGGPSPGSLDLQRAAPAEAAAPFDGKPPARVAGFDRLHQERYEPIVDNAFQSAAEHPVSTFSADVNTAGYSNVRRFLNEGQLPPPDAVRLADLVNYFPYSYPNPAGPDPVSFTLDTAPCPWDLTHRLVRVGLKARQVPAAELPPRNLVFLVDVSGSMAEPTRLPLVQRSLNLLIDQLTAKDTVSLVTYASGVSVRLAPTRGDQKANIRSAVNGLSAGGGTNGAGGIQLAYQQARAAFVEGGVNRVILCTDGDFNVGVTSDADLTALIERERAGHVFLTVLGFGMGNLKNAMLETIANHGNGHYAYVDSESEAHKVFVEQGAALTTVAKDVKLQVTFNSARVASYRLIGYENRVLKTEDFTNDSKDAGDMGAGHTVTAFYEVIPATAPIAAGGAGGAVGPGGDWLTAAMRYKHPESAASLEVARALPASAFDRPTSTDFRFASAVVEFGLLLRNSPYKGAANYDRVLTAAEANLGTDPVGHRAEFVGLVRKARRLAEQAREQPVAKTP